MAKTIDEIKQQAVSTYLGFPLDVNFGTAANNYEDADEVGTVVNRCYNDALERSLKTYPWSFARKDGTIQGTKASDPSKEHFAHYASISQFLTETKPSSATVTQTSGTNLTRLTIDVATFEQGVRNTMAQFDPTDLEYRTFEELLEGGALQFTYRNGGDPEDPTWYIQTLGGWVRVADISEFGISFYKWNTPALNNVLTVVYTPESTYCDYVTMQAVFYDPKHWSKCFDWKQYGKDTIKFAPAKLYVEYTANVDVDLYPAYFVDFLAITLALEVCAPLRVESKLPVLLSLQQGIFLDARKQDSMSEPAPASFDNIVDEARNML